MKKPRTVSGGALWLTTLLAWHAVPCRAIEAGTPPGLIAVLTDTPKSRLVRALEALYPNRVQALKLTSAQPDLAALRGFGFVVTEVRDSGNLGLVDPKLILDFARSGRTAILGLDEFARLHDLKVSVETLPNKNHVPKLSPEQFKALAAAAARIAGNLPNPKPPRWLPPDGHLPEPWMNDAVKALRAEMLEEIPRAKIAAACSMTAGFAVGDSLPWCGREDGRYVQRQIESLPDALEERIGVIAVSSFQQRPVFLREPVGEGVVYALDLRSLGEPDLAWGSAWENRGSFNKYVLLGNVLGTPLRYGHHWNRKPLAEEWGPILRTAAEQHPPLRVEVEGFTNGYNVHSLNLGDPAKPVWYAYGMYHAEDEWRSALGLVDFAVYLAERREEPEIKARLEKFCVKIIPCQTPTMYMKALRGYEPGPEQPLVEEPDRKPANLAMAFSIHECDAALQYGIVAMTGASVPLIPKAEALHRARMANRVIEWEGDAVRQAESKSWRGDEKNAEKNRFYGFAIGFEHLYRIGRPSFEKVPYGLCIEGGRRGFLPDAFLQNYQLRGLIWEEDLYRSAAINEIIADWTLSAFLTCP